MNRPNAEPLNVRDLILLAAYQWPMRAAVRDNDITLTYKDLAQVIITALAIAGRHDLKIGDRVGVAIDRSAKSTAIFLSLMAAGFIAVVLPNKPMTQLSQDVQELQLNLLVADRSSPLAALGPPVVEQQDFFCHTEPVTFLDLPETAYLTLTSGSTGRPKAVAVSHTNLVHYAKAIIERLAIQPDEAPRFAHVTTLAADLGHTAIFPTLLVGGCICVAPDHIARDPISFWTWTEQNNIDYIKTTPSHFQVLIQGCADNRIMIDTVILGGERLSLRLAGEILTQGYARQLVNHYGPSEATIGVCCHIVTSPEALANWQDTVPIGTALGQNCLSLENVYYRQDGSEVGELVIHGPGVSLGYFGRLDLTADRFEINNNRPIAFRTGDLCTKTIDGQLQFMGRKDRQIKVRGYIVNLPDVEAAIEETQIVVRAAVLVYEHEGFVRIDCAVEFEPEAEKDINTVLKLRQTLKLRLPDWMIPSRIYPLNTMPLTESGKLDYQSIERLVQKQACINEKTPQTFEPDNQAMGELVTEISTIWAQLLGLPRLDPDEDVFAAGADSIMLMQSIARLGSKNWRINMLEINEYPTPTTLARYLQSKPRPTGETQNTPIKTEKRLFSPMQEWFFNLELDDPNHYNQAILLKSKRGVDSAVLSKAIFLLGKRHPVLFQVFERDRLGPVQSDNVLTSISISMLPDDMAAMQQTITAVSRELNQSLDIARGKLFKVHLFKSANDKQDRILIIIHHLAIDGVSWRILLDELGAAYAACATKEDWSPDMPASFWDWTAKLSCGAKQQDRTAPLLVKQQLFAKRDLMSTELESLVLSLSARETKALLDISENAGTLESFLLQGFLDGVGAVSSTSEVVIDVERHGRENLQDIERYYGTVGWFTSLKQAAFPAGDHRTFEARSNTLKKILNENMIDPLVSEQGLAELCFNFLGTFSSASLTNQDWEATEETHGPTRCVAIDQVYAGRLTARIVDNQLTLDFVHDPARISTYQADRIVSILRKRLGKILSPNKDPQQDRAIGNFTREYSSTSGMILLSRIEAPALPLNINELPTALVTGATGYFGLQLIHEMIHKKIYQPICLVRGRSDAEARNRFLESYARSFGQEAATKAAVCVIVVSGNIRSPGLGLSSSLDRRVSTVFHAAADTRLLGQTIELIQTNEYGARHVVEWISQQGGIPLHYVSTLSVAGEVSDNRVFAETDFDIGQRFLSPYEESKFNAERIVRDTAARRSATYIYRMGHLASNSISGSFQTNIGDNRIYQMIKSYALSGLIINKESLSVSFSHIDVVAAAILAIARDHDVPAQVFHVENPYVLDPRQMARWLTDFGYPVVPSSAHEYWSALNTRVAKQDEVLAAAALQWSERPNRNIIFSSKRTLDIMDRLGIRFPELDYQWFKKTLCFAIDAGYMPEPKKEVFDAIPLL